MEVFSTGDEISRCKRCLDPRYLLLSSISAAFLDDTSVHKGEPHRCHSKDRVHQERKQSGDFKSLDRIASRNRSSSTCRQYEFMNARKIETR